MGLPAGGDRADAAIAGGAAAGESPDLPTGAFERHDAHHRVSQHRHALRSGTARPSRRAVRADGARDPRPLLLVPVHLGVHRLVRLHRHPRHGRSGRPVGDHGPRLARPPSGGCHATRVADTATAVAGPIPRDERSRRGAGARARPPHHLRAALDDYGRAARARATGIRPSRGHRAVGRRGRHRILRSARRRAGDQSADRSGGAADARRLLKARDRPGSASQHPSA